MDLWKLLVLGVAVLGLVLFLQIAFGPGELPTPPAGHLVEQGTYVIEQAGQRVGEETFAVWLVEARFRVDSLLRLDGRGQKLKLRGWLWLTADWTPREYEAKVETPRAIKWLTSRIEDDQATVESGVGLFRKSRKLTGTPPFVLVDSSVIGHWHAVYRFFRAAARTGEARATALVPQAFAGFLLQASPPEPVWLTVHGRAMPAECLLLYLGDQEVRLYGQGELLLGVAFPGQATVAYLAEVLPDGLRVVEPTGSP